MAAIHDEFSYLLSGDTFSRGRLTNPPHPLGVFFETFHVLQWPTYSSKYPPGQGLSLALGQVLAGEPVVGVWLGSAGAAAAVAWALLAALPPSWAVLSAFLFTAQLCWVGYWAQSYWGGALAAMAGALAFGAFLRLRSPVRWRDGLLLGAGFAIMAATRPLEGFLFALVLCGFLVHRFVRAPAAVRGRLAVRGLLSCALVTALGLGGIAVHNRAVTGSALTMPYRVHEAQYAPAPLFIFQKAGPMPEYRHEEMERFWREWSLRRYEELRSPAGFFRATGQKLWVLVLFYLFGPGLIALFAVKAVARSPEGAVVLTSVGVVLGVSLLTKGSYPHYVAPVAVCLYAGLGRGLEHLHRRARARGAVDWSLVATALLIPSLWMRTEGMARRSEFPQSRATIEERLERLPGPDVVFVEYVEGHSIHEEWVYNGAEPDSQTVVWARSMGPREDQKLKAYYPDRRAWIVTVGDSASLRPYPDGARP